MPNIFKYAHRSNGTQHTCYDGDQAEREGEQRAGTIFLRYAGHHGGELVVVLVLVSMRTMYTDTASDRVRKTRRDDAYTGGPRKQN